MCKCANVQMIFEKAMSFRTNEEELSLERGEKSFSRCNWDLYTAEDFSFAQRYSLPGSIEMTTFLFVTNPGICLSV